ncbi:orexin receptor type 2-like [Gigantopelta aegis]|uniref:orexin receptor type 2-like n=1 Tax=Gigantopelta aegis TaxID=1735272 RepID=UPI001B88E285|nr:orexin receptor type 2-like [Gigantopelta aegis]XP_041370780.1 orexin receptor type 2-like [Gigantopelta aegis]
MDSTVSMNHCSHGLDVNRTNLLSLLNEERARALVPAMVLISLLMVVGIVGNTLVCIIFCRKLEQNTQTFLFIWLAVFDLVSCCVGMPSEIVDMRLYYMFDNVVACKIIRFFLTFPTVSSNITLLVIAIHRFRKVCRPLQPQISTKVARVCIATAVFAGVVFSIPTLFIYGKRSTPTRIAGVVGSDCSVSDYYQKKSYPLVYELCLATAFVVFTVTLIVLYLRIWKTIKRHNKYMRKHTAQALNVLLGNREDSLEIPSQSSSSLTPKSRSRLPSVTDAERGGHSLNYKARELKTSNRSTVVAFLVTIVFVVSYLPHLSLIIARTVIKDFDLGLGGASLCAYNIFLRSFFVNSVANPIIYGFMNIEFRQECLQVVRKWFCWFKDVNSS